MASARIAYDSTSSMGQRASRFLRNLVEGRKDLEEYRRIVEKYADDNAGLAADLGMQPADVPLFRNLLVYAEGLLCTTAAAPVALGGVSQLRELIDAMA